MSRNLLLLFLLSVCALPVVAAPAAEPVPDGAVTLDPNVAGRPSAFVVDVDPREGGGSSQETPSSIVIGFQRGFAYDGRAVAGRCSARRAENGTCPRSSRIGGGTADGTFNAGALGSGNFTASIELFLARPQRSGDVADVIVEVKEPQSGRRGSGRGRLVRVRSGPFGYELRFDLSGAPSPPAGVTVEITRVRLRVGARRRVTVTRRVRGRPVTRTRRYTLIRNPRTCTGEWLIRLTAVYADREEARDATPPCSPR